MKPMAFRCKVKMDALLVALLGAALLIGCSAQTETQRSGSPLVPGGDPLRGRQALLDYGCGSCHTIPGVPAADATVGPPLNDWADRRYIAGNLPNEPENLIRWIRFPQEIEPGTAMPDNDVDEQTARDMSAYLYTLKRVGKGNLWPFGTGNR
jgi:cytochrome c2